MKRKLAITIMMILLVLVMVPQSAFAVITELDPATMEPINGERSNDTLNIIQIYNGVDYDRQQGMFRYDLKTLYDDYVYSSVMDGMITTDTVTFSSTQGISYAVNRNGENLGQVTEVSDPGSYQVTGGDAGTKLFSFKIVKSITTDVTVYQLPETFQVMSISFNDEDTGVMGSDSVDFTEEGKYYVKYSCSKTGMTYFLDLTVDRTPPMLQLAAVVDGEANGPVDISDVEPGSSIYIEYNGEPISYSDTLKQTGTYYIVIQDEAGNYQNYSFRINIYLDLKSWIFIALLGVAIGAVVAYILISRKHLRVR